MLFVGLAASGFRIYRFILDVPRQLYEHHALEFPRKDI